MAKTAEEQAEERDCIVIAFRAPPELAAAAETAAAAEGITRSDIARRALIRDLRARREPAHG
jgi:hypothetical protein